MKFSPLKVIALVLGFTAAAFVASEPASAAIEDSCVSECGPAPCCTILWTNWCGCWWGEEKELDEL